MEFLNSIKKSFKSAVDGTKAFFKNTKESIGKTIDNIDDHTSPQVGLYAHKVFKYWTLAMFLIIIPLTPILIASFGFNTVDVYNVEFTSKQSLMFIYTFSDRIDVLVGKLNTNIEAQMVVITKQLELLKNLDVKLDAVLAFEQWGALLDKVGSSIKSWIIALGLSDAQIAKLQEVFAFVTTNPDVILGALGNISDNLKLQIEVVDGQLKFLEAKNDFITTNLIVDNLTPQRLYMYEQLLALSSKYGIINFNFAELTISANLGRMNELLTLGAASQWGNFVEFQAPLDLANIDSWLETGGIIEGASYRPENYVVYSAANADWALGFGVSMVVITMWTSIMWFWFSKFESKK